MEIRPILVGAGCVVVGLMAGRWSTDGGRDPAPDAAYGTPPASDHEESPGLRGRVSAIERTTQEGLAEVVEMLRSLEQDRTRAQSLSKADGEIAEIMRTAVQIARTNVARPRALEQLEEIVSGGRLLLKKMREQDPPYADVVPREQIEELESDVDDAERMISAIEDADTYSELLAACVSDRHDVRAALAEK